MNSEEPFYYKYAGSSLMDMFEIAHELETRNTNLILEVEFLRKDNFEMKKEIITLKDQLTKVKKDHQETINYQAKIDQQNYADEQREIDRYRDQDLGPCFS